jgi:hypothetical protein
VKVIVKLAVAVALGVMGFAAPAAAETITVTNVTLPYYETVHVAGFTVGSNTFGGGSAGPGANEYAGQIVLTTNIGTIGTWCVDLFHYIYLGGSYTLTTTALSTDNSGSSGATSNPLSATQIQQIQSLSAYGNANLSGPADAAKNRFAALVQAAIWQVEYFGVASTLSQLGVTSDAAFNSALLTLLNTTLPTLPAAGGVQLSSLTGGVDLFTVQHLAYPVPEPGTPLALVGSILVALGLLRRRLGPPTSSI